VKRQFQGTTNSGTKVDDWGEGGEESKLREAQSQWKRIREERVQIGEKRWEPIKSARKKVREKEGKLWSELIASRNTSNRAGEGGE